jgi:hypothetical protein
MYQDVFYEQKKTNTQKTGLFSAIQLYYTTNNKVKKFTPQYEQNWWHKNVL